MMRVLIGLAALQTILLVVIGLKVFSLDADVAEARDASLDALSETAQLRQRADAMQLGAPQPAMQFADATSISADDLRRIVREEVAALPAQQVQTTAASSAPRMVSDRDLDAVRQRIDAFIARGAIEPAEMTELQAAIVRLPPDARQEMFSRLTKAMNDGEIDGRF